MKNNKIVVLAIFSLIVFLMTSCSRNLDSDELYLYSTDENGITKTEEINDESVYEETFVGESIGFDTNVSLDDSGNKGSHTSSGVPPKLFTCNIHSDLGVILGLLDYDDKYVDEHVEMYVKQMKIFDNCLYTKEDIIKLKNILETYGIPVLKDPSKCQQSIMDYPVDNPYPEKISYLYTVDGISYRFIPGYSDKGIDLTNFENYHINKVFTFNGCDVLVCSNYKSAIPSSANTYYGQYLKDGVSITIRVYDCSDINDINLEQFQWVYDISELQRYEGIEVDAKE